MYRPDILKNISDVLPMLVLSFFVFKYFTSQIIIPLNGRKNLPFVEGLSRREG